VTKMLRRPSDAENKLLLLYAVERLGPLTAQQLLLFMVEHDVMDYISIQLGLASLVDAKFLGRRAHALGILYSPTEKGNESLSMFEEKVPHSRRAHIDEQVAVWRARFRQERQMLASFSKARGGEYAVRLQLLEHDENLLDINVSIPTHKMAQGFCDAWIAEASGVYAYIMDTLSGLSGLRGGDDSPPRAPPIECSRAENGDA